MEDKNNKILHGYFESIEPYNSSFKSVKLRIFAFNKNRNKSNIPEQAYLLAAPSLYNCPIVSKYVENETDIYGLSGELSGHNPTLKTHVDEETGKITYSIYNDTFPIGLIPSSANVYYEDINEGTEENPDIKTYVVAEGCLLWMRYDASQKIEEWLNNGINCQISMEIKILSGSVESDSYKINSFEFEAICALSSKKEACFKFADISNYTKENFERSYSEMLKELKDLTQQSQDPLPPLDNVDLSNTNYQKNNLKTEGGNVVDKKLKLFQTYSILKEDDIKELKDNIDKYSLEELKEKLDYILSSQIETELRNTLRTEKVQDNWGYEYSRYWLINFDESQSIVYAEDSKDNYNIYKFNYSMNGDNVVIDFESGVKQKITFADWDEGSLEFSFVPAERFEQIAEKHTEQKSEFEKVQKDFAEQKVSYEELQSKFSALESEKNELQSKFEIVESEKSIFEEKCAEFEAENSELKSFQQTTLTNQRTEAETALFEVFTEKLSEDELKPFKETAKDFTIEQLEEKLSAFAFKKISNFELSKKPKVNVVFDRSNSVEIKTGKPYDDILSQYVAKE